VGASGRADVEESRAADADVVVEAVDGDAARAARATRAARQLRVVSRGWSFCRCTPVSGTSSRYAVAA